MDLRLHCFATYHITSDPPVRTGDPHDAQITFPPGEEVARGQGMNISLDLRSVRSPQFLVYAIYVGRCKPTLTAFSFEGSRNRCSHLPHRGLAISCCLTFYIKNQARGVSKC